jgi:replicative DNA helicase
VLFIYRPEYYGITEDSEGNSVPGLAEIIIAKHRNGPTGSVNVRFIDRYAKFVDMNAGDITSLIPMSSARQPSNDEGNIVIRRSKMNDMPDDETTPF